MTFVMFSVDTGHAQSNSRLCKNLNAELSSLSRGGGGNSKKYRQYSNAVRKQQNQLNKALKAQRRGGCKFLARNTNKCKQINGAIKKMRRNLSSLSAQRNKFAPSGANNSKKRRQIQRRINAAGCNNPQRKTRTAKVDTSKKSRRRTLLEQVFGVRTYDNSGRAKTVKQEDRPTSLPQRQVDTASLGLGSGTHRTLCVRKEDGYYFPISFSAHKDSFDLHDQLCQRMCPNHEVALYVHRQPQEDSEDMVSHQTGRPYRDEPFAFAYREKLNPDLQCQFAVAGVGQDIGVYATGEDGLTPEEIREKRVGIPVFRQDLVEVPDAYESDMTNLTQERIAKLIDAANQPEEVIADREQDPNRKIRIVGPAFFPVQ